MQELMIILCQIIDERLLATLSTHLAPSAGVTSAKFQDGDTQSECRRIKPAEIYRRMLAHSPELAPCDYSLFWPLKDALRGYHFSSDEEVKITTQCWRKCAKHNGDYNED
jgi:hypothetical protein